jgi:hypothetical protein
VEQRADARPYLRNGGVYGGFAVLAALVQGGAYVLATAATREPILAVPCSVLLPVVAFGLGWAVIGAVFRGDGQEPVDRTPLVGIAVNLVAALPALVLAGVAAFVSGSN